MHLVGFIIRIYHNARSPEHQNCCIDFCLFCIVLCSFVLFVCYVFFLTSFMSDCCMTEFVDLRNDMCACMYVCMY